MDRKIGWLPSFLIISGGLFTILHFIQTIQESQEAFEQSSGFLRALSGLAVLLSGTLIVPLITGGVIAIIGAITIWKKHFNMALISLFLAPLMLNWIGSILSVFGAIMGLIIWKKQSVD